MRFRPSFKPGHLGLLCVIWLVVSCGGTTATLSPTATSGSQKKTTAASEEAAVTMTPAAVTPITITIVYDNIAYRPELATNWGFAAVVTYGDHTLLFDTGGDSSTLLSNMAALQIDPKSIEHVVLSHEHDDHTGGLKGLLDTGVAATVHLLPSFSDSFKQRVAGQTSVVETTAGAQVMEGVFVTGEVPGGLPEQALVVVTDQGLVIITGCAHPGIDRIVARVQELFDQPVYLVLGGFHLGSASPSTISQILADLRMMGVQKVAPCHCTGEQAIDAFATEYGKDFVEAGVGRAIVVQPASG